MNTIKDEIESISDSEENSLDNELSKKNNTIKNGNLEYSYIKKLNLKMNSNDFNNTQKFNLINSNEVKNNDLIKSQEFNFNFIGTKFLWKELMKLNTKYIERSGDISSITPYVQNILCSRLTQDNIDMLSEEYIIQLVTLLQLTGQYLVYTQKMLEE